MQASGRQWATLKEMAIDLRCGFALGWAEEIPTLQFEGEVHKFSPEVANFLLLLCPVLIAPVMCLFYERKIYYFSVLQTARKKKKNQRSLPQIERVCNRLCGSTRRFLYCQRKVHKAQSCRDPASKIIGMLKLFSRFIHELSSWLASWFVTSPNHTTWNIELMVRLHCRLYTHFYYNDWLVLFFFLGNVFIFD